MAGQYQNGGYGYGKRPMWQWIVLYLVVGGLIYYAIYYFAFASKGKSLYGTTPTVTTSTAQTATPSATISITPNSVITTGTNASLGQHLTDTTGKTLYVYALDTTGVSNCTDSCATTWPAYSPASSTALPDNVTAITRTDGSKQFAYKGMPLYYFTGDSQAGQTTGNGVNSFSVARP